jgi:hypothetical protein
MAVLLAVAGCMGSSGPSVSNAQAEVTEDNAPMMAFDYSVNDYSIVLLEGTDNEIINEKELSPENNHSSIYMGEPREGEYKLVIQQGDETKTTKSVTFDGPDAKVANVEAKWSGNTVKSVVVTVENKGDLPAGVANASCSARGQSAGDVEDFDGGEATTDLGADVSGLVDRASPDQTASTASPDDQVDDEQTTTRDEQDSDDPQDGLLSRLVPWL